MTKLCKQFTAWVPSHAPNKKSYRRKSKTECASAEWQRKSQFLHGYHFATAQATEVLGREKG